MAIIETGFINIIGIEAAILLILLLIVKQLVAAGNPGTYSGIKSYLNIYIAVMAVIFIIAAAVSLIRLTG
jgi:hypothetical protein